MSFLKKMDKKKNQKKTTEDQRKKVSIKSILNDSDDLPPAATNSLPNTEVLLELDTDKVSSNPQVRTQFDESFIAELSKSMQSRGQQLPITVSETDESGTYIIQDGECRWRAAKLAGIKVKAVVRKSFKTDEDRIFDQLVANIQRDDLNPLDISKSINDLKALGMLPEVIAKELGKSRTYISRYGKLVDLPEPVLELCKNGSVNDVITLENLRKLHELNPDRSIALCKSALEEGITRKQSNRYLKEEKDIQKTGEPKVIATTENDKIINQEVIQSPSDDGFDDLNLDPPLEESKGGLLGDETDQEGEGIDPQPPIKNSTNIEQKPRQLGSSSITKSELQYREVSLGYLSISVLVQGSYDDYSLCMDRVDEDPNYAWVQSSDGVSRVHKDKIKILGIYEK